jgi:DNA-directed RNA polymerase subunit M/transcription elongation factor TFIIS
MIVDRIKSPRCPKCGAMMSLRIIEPERPGFDSRTFECPKCYDTETFVASISHEINVSIGASPAGAQAARA